MDPNVTILDPNIMSPDQLGAFLNTLTATMQSMKGQLETLENTNKVLQSQLDAASSPTPLETQLTLLIEQLQHAAVSSSTPTSSAAMSVATPKQGKSEKHPDPKSFEGNPKDLDRFTSQLHNKLRMNADRYPTEDQKVGYAFSRLEGPAATAMEGFWTTGACLIHSLADFNAHLARLYGDPNKKEHAANQWLQLRQGNHEFTTFLAEFEKLAAIATITDDTQKRRQLSLAIGDKLRFRMVTLDTVPADYVSFRDKCIQIESRLLEANSLSALSKTTSIPRVHSTIVPPRFPSNTPRTTPYSNALTIRPNPTLYATGANAMPIAERTTTQGGNLMDLSRNRGPLTPQEKQRRRDHNLCLYCGGSGHLAQNCLRRGPHLSEIRIIEEVEDNQSLSESGKESSLSNVAFRD